ncbi:sulfatase-modifying factor enzyme 1 [Leptospira broomii serovar Hurstbridge str. 5399]|uniref:Sulfatase-modifying factor enzyme 1 n=1 Tax=Leptospira broomii serovar Hurstbridge str. 5399 TaxID=1049789 RepID=T0GAF7_9LEPT|nr:formylglycine-generating enzyme family protein [Leptospira broomii]EQA43814.1 sulfatase-modifying factor enzyme 1 [Leptospira broomii serovar Hurstbridge str. 5399]
MVKISAGFFLPFLTSEKEKPILVKEFLMDSDSVTNAEFAEFLEKNPAWKKGSAKSSFVDDMYLNDFEEKRIKYPGYSVVNISWFAARAYCNWKGKRLPTTSEWERIAQSELNDKSKQQILKKILDWYAEPAKTVDSKSFKSYTDRYGVRDLFGNVWEWVEDFNSFSSSIFSDREGAARGSFCASGTATVKDKTDYASFMRYAYRNSLKAKYSASNLGFRCAKNIEP